MKGSGLSRWLPALAAVGVTWGLYAGSLYLPFFWDDHPVLPFAQGHSWLSLWTDATDFPFYRPATFTIWKLVYTLFAPTQSFPAHVLMLLVHAANSLLAGHLAGRLAGERPGRAWARLGAAALFAAYPFASLPVAHPASLFHLAGVLCSLAAVSAGLEYLRRGRGRWLAAAAGLTVLAPFFQETGVMAGVMLGLLFVLLGRHRSARDRLALAAFPLSGALFFALWLVIPKSRAPLALPPPDEIFANAVFFLQAPSYPVQWISQLLLRALGGWDLGWVALVGLAGLAASGLMVRGSGQERLWLAGLGWAGLTSLTSLPTLPFSYVITSPRLLYYPGPGAALIWTAAALALAARFRRPAAHLPLKHPAPEAQRPAPRSCAGKGSGLPRVLVRGRRAAAGLGLGLAAFSLLPGAGVVLHEIALHEFALRPLRELAAEARAWPGQRLLVVNAVNWVNYQRSPYVLGHAGVNVLASYIDLQTMLRLNAGSEAQVEAVTRDDLKTPLSQHYYSTANEHLGVEAASPQVMAELALDFDRMYVTQYADDGIRLEYVGAASRGPASAPGAYQASFEGQVYLLEGSVEAAGQAALVRLDWQYLGPDPGATVFRHVLDCAGQVLGLGDGDPLGRTVPLGQLPPGARVHDERLIPLERLPAGGCLILETGLFRPDGSRVPALGPNGEPLPNDAVYLARP